MDFKKKKSKSVDLTRKTFKQFYPIYEEGLNTLLKAVDILIKETENNKDSLFNKAALLLLSRSIQHSESVLLLTENGLYGDTWVIIRSIFSDMNMFQYLHLRPELIKMFLEESANDYQSNKEFNKSFSETAIRKELESHGMSSFKNIFDKMSKTAHASSWGAQLYGTRASKKNQYHFKYGPGFETEKALAILSGIVSSHYDYLNLILLHRYHNKLDIDSSKWEKIKEETLKLEEEVRKFSNIGILVLFKHNFKLNSNQ